MSLLLQFEHLIQNETAKKAMNSYVGFLEKAFIAYRDLWEEYINLQEQYNVLHEQYNASLPQVTIAEPCANIKDKLTVKKQLNSNTIVQDRSQVTIAEPYKIKDESTDKNQLDNSIIVEDSDDNSLLELDSLYTDVQKFFDDGMETNLANLNEDFLTDSSPSKSPVFYKTYPKTSSTSSSKLFMQLPEAASVCSKSAANTKMFRDEKTSKCKQKLGISTTYHVGTTFLPNGKKLTQSRLTFPPAEHYKEKIPSCNVCEDEFKETGTMQKAKQNLTDTLAVKKPIATEDSANETFFEDVTEISPTQRDIQSKPILRHYLNRKRKISGHTITNSPDKNKYHNFESNFATETAIDTDLEHKILPFVLKPQMSNSVNNFSASFSLLYESKAKAKSIMSIDNQGKDQVVKDTVQNDRIKDTIQDDRIKVQDMNPKPLRYEIFGVFNRNSAYIQDDIENKPPAKKPLLNEFHVSPKKKKNVSKQLNMRCKADRAKLNGGICWQCEKFYKDLPLSEEELQKRKNQCSRHRQKYERPRTPEGFWDPEFPETLSCTYRQPNIQ